MTGRGSFLPAGGIARAYTARAAGSGGFARRGRRTYSTVVAIVIAIATRLSPAIRPEATGTVYGS